MGTNALALTRRGRGAAPSSQYSHDQAFCRRPRNARPFLTFSIPSTASIQRACAGGHQPGLNWPGHRTPAIMVLGSSVGGQAFPEGAALVLEPSAPAPYLLGILALAPFRVAASMAADAHSPGTRIGAQLQVHHLAHHAFAAFQMKWRAGAIRGPEAPSFPARIRIIDSPIQALGEEAHRVGNAQAYKPSVH